MNLSLDSTKTTTNKTTNFVTDFVKKESFSGILLFIVAILAMVVANIPATSDTYFHFWELDFGITIGNFSFIRSAHFWVNDALMALFFLMLGLEVKRELLVGHLSTFEKAIAPIFASIGGIIFPILIFLYFTWGTGSEAGFAIPMGTDTAFALGILMILGKRIPTKLKVFLVTLAVGDDVGAILVIAIFYGHSIAYDYLIYTIAATALLFLLNRIGIRSLTPYIICGVAVWYLSYKTGVHPTISGLILACAIPLRSKISSLGFLEHLRIAVNVFYANTIIQKENEQILLNNKQNNALEIIGQAYDEVQSPLVRLEHYLHPLSAFLIMPIFAFANAGVKLENGIMVNEIFWGISLGLLIGKPFGIFCMTYIVHILGISKKPSSLSWGHIFGAGLVASIGFTMSILISTLSYESAIQQQATLSVLVASLVAIVVSIVYFLFLSPNNDESTTKKGF